MRKIKAQQGQAVIETAVALSLLVLFLCPAVIALIHLFASQIYFQHQLYNFLVCKEVRQNQINCESHLRKQSKTFLLETTIKNFYFEKNNDHASAELILKTWYAKKIKIHEHIHLPLQ